MERGAGHREERRWAEPRGEGGERAPGEAVAAALKRRGADGSETR